MGEGMYKTFLGVNVVGHIVCLVGTILGFCLHQYVPALHLGGCDGEPTTEDAKTGRRVPQPGYGDAEDGDVAMTKAQAQPELEPPSAVPSAVSLASA